jgi:CRISP-associated protein Cas1
VKDLHILPKIRDGWTYLYVEHARIEQHDKAIAVHDKRGRTPVPCAMLTTLMLGPGTTITHAAVRTLAEHGCLVIWSGEDSVRFYAEGLGETRSASNLMHQARLWADPDRHLDVVRRLYEMRFDEPVPAAMSLQQVRGREGLRVRAAYAEASRRTGVPWAGRSYKRDNWHRSDGVNRALSAANACLYGVCHAAIVSAGFSPALGFIHTGKTLSFVYDVADLYKTSISIPAAFDAAKASPIGVERRARERCREVFRKRRLLARLVPDIQYALFLRREERERHVELDTAESDVGSLWDADGASVGSGVNYGDQAAGADGGGVTADANADLPPIVGVDEEAGQWS